MASITYTDLQTLLNTTTPSATACEYIIDHAIDLLNAYGADIANMTGTAGSKTWSGESKEKGAVMEVAMAVYSSGFVTAGGQSASYNIGPVGVSSSSNSGAASPENLAKELARNLIEVEAEVG